MFRERIILKLQRRMENLEVVLKKNYDSHVLSQWCRLEKEIEIQKAYIENER